MKEFYIEFYADIDTRISSSVRIKAKSKKEAVRKFKEEYDDFDIKCLLKEDFTIEDIDDFDCSIAEIKGEDIKGNFEDFEYYDD